MSNGFLPDSGSLSGGSMLKAPKRIVDEIRCITSGRGSKGSIIVCSDPTDYIYFDVRVSRKAPFVWVAEAGGRVGKKYVRKVFTRTFRGRRNTLTRQVTLWIRSLFR